MTIELKVRDLSIGDQFTDDDGETWHEVERLVFFTPDGNVHTKFVKGSTRVAVACVGGYDEDDESGTYRPDDLVVIR